MMRRMLWLPVLLFAGVPSAHAQDAAVTSISGSDTAWLLVSTALVLLMTPALAFFYGGLVRAKNALNTMMMSFIALGVAGVLWALLGYSLAFGPGNLWVGDTSMALLAGVGVEPSGSIPHLLFMAFQGTFAIITVALISGAVVERMRFPAYVAFIGLWVLLVYAPVCHWVWGGGWLGELGALDFAGGAVVHVNAGAAAVVAALFLGPRKDYGRQALLPHHVPFVLLGAGLLWFGWFGFNGGSALAADGNAAMAILVTHLSAAMGTLTWLTIEWIRYGKPSMLGAATGMVAGLGTITPASGFVGPGGAIVIGLLAGIVCFSATNYLKKVLKIDDSLDVFPVHGVGGILGTLLAGVFSATTLGVFSGYGFADGIDSMAGQLKVQAIGVIATLVFTAVATWIILKLLDALIGLRVSDEEETQGLDLSQHEERGYDL